MKIRRITNSGWVTKGVLFVLSAVTVLSSCKLENDYNVPETSSFSLVNAFSGAPGINLYVDNMLVNVTPVQYKQSTPYINLYSGNRKIDITRSGSLSPILTGVPGFTAGKFYTMFIARKFAGNTDSIYAVIKQDTITSPATGKVRVRFANLTPESPALDIYAKGGSAIFSAKAFKSISSFQDVEVAAIDTIVIRQAGQTTGGTEVPLAIQENKVYTISSHGLWNVTTGDTKFGAQLTVNK